MTIDEIINSKTSQKDFESVFPRLKQWLNVSIETTYGDNKGINILTREEADKIIGFMKQCTDEQFFKIWWVLNGGTAMKNLAMVHEPIKYEVAMRAERSPSSAMRQEESK